MKNKIFGFFILLSVVCFAQKTWATCANYTTYADGQVLTAGSLNSLQTNYTNCINAILDGDVFTGDINLYSGADIIGYSNTGTTKTFQIDNATGEFLGGLSEIGHTINCNIYVSATTLTIKGDDGIDLSGTNPCIVTLIGTSNYNKTVFFRSNVTVTFDATSDTDGNTFGITSSVDWDQDMPIFLGLITDGTNTYFTISRTPRGLSGTASTDLCQKGDNDCDLEGDVMILGTGLTLSSWTLLPITQVGWFIGTWVAATTSWTFYDPGSYTGYPGGFNFNYEKYRFRMPHSQKGSTANSFFQMSAGNAPTWASPSSLRAMYNINRTGYVIFDVDTTSGGNCTNGSAGNTLRLSLPYVIDPDFEWNYGPPAGRYTISSHAADTDGLWVPNKTGGLVSYVSMYDSVGFTAILGNEFSATSDDIMGRISYFAEIGY